MIRTDLRQEIITHYRPGQEVTKDPSDAYLAAAKAAIADVARKEAR
jgi:hypothetical protein